MTEKFIPSIQIDNIDMASCYFNPGCALRIYKPEVAELMGQLLSDYFGPVKDHDICCRHNPGLPAGSTIINNCAGCDRRFRSEYEGIRTISFWEILDSIEDFPFPSHKGLTVSVHDSCSFRQKPQVHAAVRSILRKMEIEIVESPYSVTKSICCGDNFYGHISSEQVALLQKKRADQMPCQHVVVYCIGCVRSMTVGGKTPLYLPDLILGKETELMTNTLESYHRDLEHFIETH